MPGAPVPPARRPGWDDGLADAVAAVEAMAAEDVVGMAMLLRHASLGEAVVVLAKLVAEVHRECGCLADGSFRAWAAEAVHFS